MTATTTSGTSKARKRPKRRFKEEMPKAESQYRHAVRRAHERYARLGDPERIVRSVRRLIRGSESICIDQPSKRRAIHVLEYQGFIVLAAYDRFRHQLITLLPARDVYKFDMPLELELEIERKLDGARFP